MSSIQCINAAKTFNATLRIVLDMFEKKAKQEVDIANIDRLKKRIALVKSQYSEAILCDLALEVFIIYKDHILVKNEDFFLKLDIKAECARRGLETSSEIFPLIEFMKAFYCTAKPMEKELMWEKTKQLYESSLEYRIGKQLV